MWALIHWHRSSVTCLTYSLFGLLFSLLEHFTFVHLSCHTLICWIILCTSLSSPFTVFQSGDSLDSWKERRRRRKRRFWLINCFWFYRFVIEYDRINTCLSVWLSNFNINYSISWTQGGSCNWLSLVPNWACVKDIIPCQAPLRWRLLTMRRIPILTLNFPRN